MDNRKFYDYCLGHTPNWRVDNSAIFVKIASEFNGVYHYVEELDYDVIDFETSEDLLRFKIQFS